MFANACVAIAPTWGSAAGTPAPTARDFDCTATPHSAASRSQATIEYVEGLAILQLPEVEVHELTMRRRDEDAGDLRAFERRANGLGVCGADDYRDSLRMRFLEASDIVDPVEDERVADGDVVLTLDGDFRDTLPRRAEPALPHSSYVAPSAMSTISQLVVSASRHASGVPVRSGNVP